MSSNRAPVCAATCSSSAGISGAIETPVTMPIRFPSSRGSVAIPSASRIRSAATAPTPFSICGNSP